MSHRAGRTAPIAATLLAVTVLLAGCNGDDDVAAPTTTAPGTTTSTAEVTTTTRQAAVTVPSSTFPSTTTTTTTIVPSAGTLSLTGIVFIQTPHVTVTNVGNEPIELGDHWLVSGEARHRLPALSMGSGDTVVIGIGEDPPPVVTGTAAGFDLGPVLGPVLVEDGEMALYSAARFAEPAALVDYVEWGSSGHRRSAVAVEAGLWEERAFVPVPPEAQALSSSGEPSAGPEDWSADVGG